MARSTTLESGKKRTFEAAGRIRECLVPGRSAGWLRALRIRKPDRAPQT
jgi:hypothetical protein